MQRADSEHCLAILREGSRSFFAASRLLPTPVREELAAVYAFCRQADDEIDEGAATEARLERLQQRLDRIYQGVPGNDPVERAVTEVINRHGIPRAIPQALLEGFGWEVAGRRYRSLEQVEAYSARVAGTVGVMVTLVMGRRDSETLARAVDLGVAMQLTNIARDVGEDARRGRIYLPLDWLEQAGVDSEELVRAPHFSHGLGQVVARLLDRAEVLYRSSDPGIARLPRHARVGIRAARLMYADIGQRIADRGHDSISARAYTTLGRKLLLAARAIPARWHTVEDAVGRGITASHPAQFLVDAITTKPGEVAGPPSKTVHLRARGKEAERLEAALRVAVSRVAGPGCPPKLAQAIDRAVFPSGHRLRPRLCYAVAEALGEDEPQLVDAAAVALELLHCASLIQDDLPSFDDASERRGRPALHQTHGEALAILASDALILGAFNSLAAVAHLRPERVGRLVGLLSDATGAPAGLVAGQAWESEDGVDLASYHQAKTGALFEAATMGAALACGHDPEPWRELGCHLGLAYQTADDLRDAVSPDQSDASLGRPNVAHEMGSEASLARLRLNGRRAMESIPGIEGADGLRQLVAGLVRQFEAVGSAPEVDRHLAGSGVE